MECCASASRPLNGYNELTALLSNAANAEVLVQETGDELLLLHRVVHGGASRSYGIKAARQVLVRIEANSQVAVGLAPQG